MIGEQSINLTGINCPLLNIYTLQDHLVPPEASLAFKR